ncbi:MAG: FAD-dependent monooxygenase [Halocynthiibacter sp.]
MDIGADKITIVGGGIGGLTAANALAQRGARVRLLEQAPHITEVGAGLQISPNGMRVLRALGLGPIADDRGTASDGVELIDGCSGRIVMRMDLRDQDYKFFHRADLIELLANAARASHVDLKLLQQVNHIELGDVNTVTMAQGQVITPKILIGADGLHSKLRPEIAGARQPFFTNQVAWRCLVPLKDHVPNVARIYMGPKRHIVTYPLRGGSVLNVVAVEERREWADEGWFHRDDPANLQAAFSMFCPDIRKLLSQVDDVYLWGLFRHDVAQVWAKGQAALLGDAAHPTLPFMAQGAVMAMEDAWMLGHMLAAANERQVSVAQALKSYETGRIDRVRRVIAAANANAGHYHIAFAPKRVLAHGALRALGKIKPDFVQKRFDWIYGYDVTQQK